MGGPNPWLRNADPNVGQHQVAAPPPPKEPTALNSPAHTGAGIGNPGVFAIPKVPNVSSAPVGSPQEAQDKQAAALLTPLQQQQYQKLASTRDAQIAALHQRQTQLKAFGHASQLGPQGVRVQQALLNRNGYNLPVDGKLTPETANAIQDYVNSENKKAVGGAASAYNAANPISIRQAANQQLQSVSPAARAQVVETLTQQLTAATKAAGPTPNPDQANTIAAYKRAIALAQDPINGYDNTQVQSLVRGLSSEKLAPDAVVVQHNSIWDRVKEVAGIGIKFTAGPLLDELKAGAGWFGDAMGAGYDAAQQAMNDSTLHNHGGIRGATDFIGRWGLGADAFFSADITHLTGGVVHVPGDNLISQAVEQTDTAAKRAALVKEGDILSVGKLITGEWTPAYERIHGAPPQVQVPVPEVTNPEGGFGLGMRKATIFGKGAPDPTIAGSHLLSGVLDLTLYSTKDPTVLLTGPLGELTSLGSLGAEKAVQDAAKLVIDEEGTTLLEKVGEPAVRSGYRRMVVDGTTNGRALFNGIGDIFREGVAPQTVKGLRDAIPGLDAETAQAAVDAWKGETAGSEAARIAGQKVIEDAYVTGKFAPKVGWVRQFTNFAVDKAGALDTGEGGLLKPIGPGHGLSFVTETLHRRLDTLREWAAPKGETASLWEHDATSFVNGSLDTAAARENTTWRSIYADTVAANVEHNDIPTRMWNVIDGIHEINNPALTAAMEGMIRPYIPSEQLLLNMPIATFNEAMAQLPDMQVVIQRLEVATAIFKGEVGDAAAAQFKTDLARGYAIAPDFNRKLVSTAAENVGLTDLGKSPKKAPSIEAVANKIEQLPQDIKESMQERLANIKQGGTNIGLRALARDVNLVADTPALREEMQRLLEQVKSRGQLFGESAGATQNNILQRGIGKAVGAVTTVVPPQELRFEYPTANEAAHGVLRSQAGDRYMSAFHVDAVVRGQILNDLYNAKTEEQMFSAVRRMVRVSIESTGVENPGAIIDMLAERGDFAARVNTNVIRSVDENGNPVADLQTLAQRIEGTRVPSPTEVARMTRKAILDGAQDSTLAERMAARLKTTVDAAGNVHLFWTRADGRVQDIAGAAHSIHRVWKFLVVSNAGMPLVGAVAGFVGGKGSVLDRLGNAGLGFALGSLGMTRFIFRVAGVEDRFRIGMESGFTADNMIPGYSRMRAMKYSAIVEQDPLRRTLSDDIVRVGNYGVSHFENDMLVHTDPDWVVVKASDANAADAWYRVINHQIKPETDPVMATLLREQAGHLGVQTNTVEVPAVAGELVKNAVPAAETGTVTAANDALAAAAQAAVDAAGPSAVVTTDNATLLERYAERDTKPFFRGEPADVSGSARGSFFTENEAYAAKHAGEGGIVYRVELPIGSDGVPLVGILPNVEDSGWKLAGHDAVWADAAVPVFSPHFTEGTAATTHVVVETQRQAADRIIAEFLNTEEGQMWTERWKNARLGAAKPEAAIQRMRDFLTKYSDQELAAMRVAGGPQGSAMEIDRETLARKLANGTGPSEIHAQQVWKMPRGIREVFRSAGDLLGRTTLTAFPNMNRIGFETSIFNGEYDRLVQEGVSREEAQRIADGVARETVNGVMHRFDEPSRFAAKIDMFSPFFHAKEDIIRVYGTLALENPLRTFRVVEQVARAFNNGKDNGIFRKDQFTGQWELTIPGGARLAHSLFGVPFEVNFSVPLQDFLFVGVSAFSTTDPGLGGGLAGTLASSVLPSPGGPFWSVFARELANHDPSLFLGTDALHKWLFGYGPNGNLLSSNTSRLWMAMAGSTPPWEFANQEKWQNQLVKWRAEVGAELLYQNAVAGKNGHGPDWVPSDAEVDSATKKFFKAWSFFGATVPAPSFPVLASRESYYAAENAFTLGGRLPWDQAAFLKAYPQFEPYLAVGGVNKYTGPEDLATLKGLGVGTPYALGTYDPKTGLWNGMGNGENSGAESSLGFKTPRSWAEYKDSFKLYQRTNEYYRLKTNASANPNLGDRERAITALNHKYSDVVGSVNAKAEIRSELTFIKYNYPKSAQQGAYNRIKAQYGLSNSDLLKALSGVNDPTYHQSIWANSRYGPDIVAEVVAKFGMDSTSQAVQQYVGALKPTEQARYWQYMMDSTGYDKNLDDPNAVLNRYFFYESQYYATKDQYPQLAYVDPKADGWVNPFTKFVQDTKTNTKANVNAAFIAIDQLTNEINAAYATKNWKAYDALSAKRTSYYNVVDATRDQWLGKLPDLTKYYEDLHAATVYEHVGNHGLADQARAQAEHDRRQALMDRAAGKAYVYTSEQARFLYMPSSVQQAYVGKLVDALNMPAGKLPYDVKGYVKQTTGLSKLFWSYLTPVQQSILEAMYGPNQIETWKYQDDFYLNGPGQTPSFKNHYKGGATLNGIPSELLWSHAILGKYDTRKGPAPKGWEAYLKLPHNPAVKANFLINNPDVAAYLTQGPLGQMSNHERDIVVNTLNKYGHYVSAGGNTSKYSRGRGGKSWYGLHPAGASKGYNGAPGPQGSGYADYKWAKYQLFAWNRRTPGSKAPATYDLWLNMPSGQAKAVYLEQHPEIGAWLKLGPMANMPQEYQAVVRSILQQYGDWTQQQNPLSDTISKFYATPQYAKQEFLAQHPELQAYWSAIRSPQEQQMFDLQQTYFQIKDVGGKRAFLEEHPELQQHFLDARTQRYESFLNQVAAYMGANPAMFTQYLNDQQAVLAELLRRFAEPNLIREKAPISEVAGNQENSDSGRSRAPQSHRAARQGV